MNPEARCYTLSCSTIAMISCRIPHNSRRSSYARRSAGRRWALCFVCAAYFTAVLAVANPARALEEAFRTWIEAFWPDAEKFGISRKTYDDATRGLQPDLSLPDLELPDKKSRTAEQAEFVLRPSDYLHEAIIDKLAATGRKLLLDYKPTLEAIELRFGVPGNVVLAIWGRESGFSRHYTSRIDAVRALATQAYIGRRKDMFKQELLFALKMIQDGEVKAPDMQSSWAGTMGLTQFLPSDFYKYAVDFDGDGRRDIWNSVPDALASTANQLGDKGWRKGERWAYEARVPKGVDCTLANPDHKIPIREWVARGVSPSFNRTLNQNELSQAASLLLPAGTYGPGFLILPNYFVIKDYNFSDLYVLFVGELSDRILGGRGLETPWANVVQLKTAHVEEMQRRLAQLGFYPDKIDGKAGMRTRLALGMYQKANGLKVDCWPTVSVLQHLRARSGEK